MVTVKQVATRADLRKFVEYPNRLYKGNPYYVPELLFDEFDSLNPKKNPAYEHSEAAQWLAYKDGMVAGRVMALINHHVNKIWGKKQARFSRLDFIDDTEVSQSLVAQAEAWARERGMEEIVGPMGFCDFDKEGMLVEGFEELSTFATYYNHPYYKEHVAALGFEKEVDWVEFQLTVPEKADPKIARIAELVAKKTGFKLLEFKTAKEALPWGKQIFDLFNDAYRELFGFVTLTDKEIDYYIKKFFGFINPAFIKGVVDAQNKIVAFGITLPSLSRALQKSGGHLVPFGFIPLLRAINHNDRLDMYLVAVKPEYQNLGVNAMLMDAIYREAIKHQFKLAESNPELEENEKVQAIWKTFPRRQHRRRRVFIKKLV